MVSKFFFVRILRGSRHLSSNTLIHWVTWFGCVGTAVLVAYLIASGIPIFDRLVSFFGAFLGALMVFQPLGVMWIYDNWNLYKRDRTLMFSLRFAWAIFVIVLGTFLMVAGTYSSIVSIIDAMDANEGTRPWSCVDNSNSEWFRRQTICIYTSSKLSHVLAVSWYRSKINSCHSNCVCLLSIFNN